MSIDQEQVIQLDNSNNEDPIGETSTQIEQLDLEPPTTQQSSVEQETPEDEDEDDFGEFSDASFDDFEEPKQSSTLQSDLRIPQSLFSQEGPLLAKLQQITSEAFDLTLPNYTIPSDSSILNERSSHLLERLVSRPHLKPYNWQHGSLRKKLLQTLGLPEDNVITEQRVNSFDADSYEVVKFEELGIGETDRKDLLEKSETRLSDILDNLESVATLSVLDSQALNNVIKKFEQELKEVEIFLSSWEHEKDILEKDNKTFESVVENLTGHTQRLRREETMKSLKKEKEKTNRLSFIFKGKSNKK